jgi:hypothetical protein
MSAASSACVVALLRNSRRTECGAGQFLVRFAVRAAPFALPPGRGSVWSERRKPEDQFGLRLPPSSYWYARVLAVVTEEPAKP